MRVNISYAVEIDELPTKVWELIRETSKNLSYVNEELEQMVQGPSQDEMVNVDLIDDMRKQLATIDAQLADYSAILAGYVRTKAELYMAEQERDRQMAGEVSAETQALLDQIEENENDSVE